MVDTGSRLTELACRACCTTVTADRLVGTCPTCGHTLQAEYDLRDFDGSRWWKDLVERRPSLWRYRELLPVRRTESIVTLGEGGSPSLPLRAPPEAEGIELWAKDDGGLPTGSFKARGMTVAISRATELGASRFFVPSAGNAGLAAAAYCARAGASVRVYVPEGTPRAQRLGVAALGAEVVVTGANLREAGERARQAEAGSGRFDLSTLREPYRAEGKKTMAFEIAEAFGPRSLPDAIVYPAGGGTGLLGLHAGFRQLDGIGLVDHEPRLIAVQAEGCAPIVRALTEGTPAVRPWEDPRTEAKGLLVPAPFSSERILEAVRASGGGGVTVPEAAIRPATEAMARRHGLIVAPEAAATYAAVPQLAKQGLIRSGERILLYLTGSGLPYLNAA